MQSANVNRSAFASKLIAPCGINCGVCRAHLRANKPCNGCYDHNQVQPKTRDQCPIRLCDKRKSRFCFDCAEFPCDQLRHLDKRYRTKYGMSEIENLNFIKKNGIRKFLESERRKWISDKGVRCVHDGKYYR